MSEFEINVVAFIAVGIVGGALSNLRIGEAVLPCAVFGAILGFCSGITWRFVTEALGGTI